MEPFLEGDALAAIAFDTLVILEVVPSYLVVVSTSSVVEGVITSSQADPSEAIAFMGTSTAEVVLALATASLATTSLVDLASLAILTSLADPFVEEEVIIDTFAMVSLSQSEHHLGVKLHHLFT